ncbi:MAG TPA: VIT and VWA domain-containing protein [Bryobacteraceae bacterium]|jgi:Ca-activated chloride channel family protein
MRRPTFLVLDLVFSAICSIASSGTAIGDAGVLVPAGREQPDPRVFSLDEMSIKIVIDSGMARVSIQQIYGSHVNNITEGQYVFALPTGATVSEFAVWDGLVRIPGVILERKRAGEIYEQAKAQLIDPGLLQMGERDVSEAGRSNVFSAKIMPIPPYSTKRMELEYYEPVRVENFQSQFSIPLRPDAYQSVKAGKLSVDFEFHSDYALRSFQVSSKSYELKITEQTPRVVRASWEAADVDFTEDMTFDFSVDPNAAGRLRVLTHRDDTGPGFFEASTLLPRRGAATPSKSAGRTVIALFDNSLSMQWEKLERTYQACESLLRSLRPSDRFNLILFNSELKTFEPAPVEATRVNVDRVLAFVQGSPIQGGTNLQRALQIALQQAASGESYLVLLTDGGASEGTIHNGRLASWYSSAWNNLPVDRRPHTFAFAVGDDANMPLLKLLARNGGQIEWVRSTEPIEFKLKTFLSRIGQEPARDLDLRVSPMTEASLVYPLQESSFSGSVASWVGQYEQAFPRAVFSVHGSLAGAPYAVETTTALPARSLDHPSIPRTWARARVDALLEKITRDGEDRASIDEIIRLSRKYKFVTPYTSFLAVPRALLRPRVIRPGDPVLRIHTDPSIVSVTALFPFGLIKPLRHLDGEDVWQTRFLAPADMTDGAYSVRLILRDRDGHVYRESKSFVIASKPPVVRVKADKQRYRGGDPVQLRVQASGMTRTITARLSGAMPVSLHWNSAAAANTGELMIPEGMAPGKYRVYVTAEDIAHNIGAGEVSLEIW